MNTNKKRLTILTQPEIQDYFGLPRFTLEEREYYFTLSDTEHQIISQDWSVNSRVNFILMLGYFKSRKIFFTYTLEGVITDISYILACHFPDHSAANIKVPGKTTRIQLQRLICQHLNYQRYGSVMAEQLAELAARVVKRSANPGFILRALLSHLNKNQIITPAYSTQLKKALRDFSYTEIVRESTWVKQLSPLYEFACQWLPSLCISNESIRYYATLIEYYSVYKLRRFDPLIAYFYLLCYTYHRTHVINDNLVEAFIGHVRQYEEAAKLFAKDMVYKRKSQANEDIKATGKILGFFLNPDITDNVSFGEIRAKAFQVLNREKMEIVTLFIGSSGFDEEEFHWQHLETLSAAFKKNLRQIIRVLDFSSHTDESGLLEAAIFVQTCLRDGKITSTHS
ncbi:hypothetical protein CKY10_10370 [Photorhabdus sp. HUG-39]|uniref:DUF4158 domain-containing protein n=1 Tax=Photorhabdus kayaii TaxID=230088 RepID=A0ABX0AXY8_9GAMM|nr:MULTISPECIES: DUF4158 domain-containing protein [Photorhabdus]MCC8373128.1 DUF4158 domain-containing protein [Photorhabdus bodei]NDL12033.1 DUF4158 domain-containing protein [Photorhabdus kayaii]NDL25666.1 DUF4158 domain-containing protein [Photorhabdus kayaii]RAX09837.1 hypothetical protein CKY10_10370 [Photorhabdus sp. HUG-39]